MTTYAELKQAIQDYLENYETTFVNNLPLFIRLAEERILKNVQLNLFQKNQSGNMTAGNQYLTAPTDFLSPISLSIDVAGAKEFLQLKDLDFIQSYNPDPTVTGQPRYYGQFDVDNFIIAPTPDLSYAVDIHYMYRPASLTAGAEGGTTWLSENAEIALLYGSMVEAYTFMKGDPDLMQVYVMRANEALARVKHLGESLEPVDQFRYGKVVRPRT